MGTANALNNRINIPTATTTAFSITDPTNTYLSINSTAARPRSGLPLESTITGPLTMNGGYCINWPGGVYNSTAALSASQSGTTVTGTGTNFPSGCAGGFIYWPSTQQAAVIQTRVSGTQLTVDISQTQALAPFVIYYAGVNIDYAGLRQLQGQSLWTNIIDTPPSSVGQGTTLSIGPTNATAVSLVPALSLTTPLSPASGGTGVNNGTKTITLGGNLATSGAFNSSFTMTNTTAVTFPTTGTLATTTDLGAYLPLTGGTLTGTLGLSGDPTSHIGIDWLGADQQNYERVQNNQLQALAVIDVAGNQYWHVNSLTARPKLSLDIETQINTPLIDTNVLATGTIYNASGALSASASGGSVTGSGTNFPVGCANGIIYWPSTQNYARITVRNSATSLTIDTSISISSLPFVIYWGGVTYNPQTNIFALSSSTSLVLGDGSVFALSGSNSTTLTTTGTTNVTLPTSGTLATTSQIPAGAALTKADDTNVTLALAGSPTTALVNAASITAGWTGQLSAARGGTGANNTATTGTILRGNGTNFVPTTATYPATATSTGTILRADGTNWSATTATYPNTTTANQLLYSSATSVIGGLATAANGTLVTDGSSVPSISSTLPSAVQNNITAVNSAANTLSIGGSTKTFTSGAANIPTFSAVTSWTPGIAFGGGTTGITYGSQPAFYRTITYPNGTIEVAVWGSVNLSNKGSSTGAATLTGLPVTTGPNATTNLVPFTPAGITVAAGALALLQINNSTTTANIDTTNMNGGGFAQVTNTQFSNSSSVAFNFTYWNN